MKLPLIVLISAAFLWGCQAPEDARTPLDAAATESGGRHAPQSETERALLEHAAMLPAGVRERVGAQTISASEPYKAASGFTCRRLFLEAGGQQETKLACGDDEGWFFVPDVYRDEQPAAPEPQAEVKLSPTGEATAIETRAVREGAPASSDDEEAPERAGP